jgi:hypothetical protein
MKTAITYCRAHPEWPIDMPPSNVIRELAIWSDTYAEYEAIRTDLCEVVQAHRAYQQRVATLQRQPSPTQPPPRTEAPKPGPTFMASYQPSGPDVPKPGLFTSRHSQGIDPLAAPTAQPTARPRPIPQFLQRPQTPTHDQLGLSDLSLYPPLGAAREPSLDPPLSPRSANSSPRRAPRQSRKESYQALPDRSPKLKSRKIHLEDPPPEKRHGGKAPWERYVFTIPLSDCKEYPEDLRDPSRRNDMHLRANTYLGLCSDEDPGLCYGIFMASKRGRCPYADRPHMCRNQHHLEQKILDWVVANRGITRGQSEVLVGNYRHNTPTELQRSLRVPDIKSCKAATPESLQHARESSQTAQTHKGQFSPWNNSTSAIHADDEKIRTSRKDPTHTPAIRETQKNRNGTRETTVHAATAIATPPVPGPSNPVSVQSPAQSPAQSPGKSAPVLSSSKSASKSTAVSGLPDWGDESDSE